MIVYAIFATVSWFIIERAGRRQLYLWGTVGQGLSMVIVFACLIPGTASAAKGAAVGLFTYIASFGATWLPLPWVSLSAVSGFQTRRSLKRGGKLYPAEISPIKTRAKANALSTCSNWLFNFCKSTLRIYSSGPLTSFVLLMLIVIVMITPIMITNIGWGTYLFFAVVNACFLPIIYFLYPETKRRSLEEIDIIFAKGYCENMSYVRAARELPFLADEDIDRMAKQYGLVEAEEREEAEILGIDKMIEKGD